MFYRDFVKGDKKITGEKDEPFPVRGTPTYRIAGGVQVDDDVMGECNGITGVMPETGYLATEPCWNTPYLPEMQFYGSEWSLL